MYYAYMKTTRNFFKKTTLVFFFNLKKQEMKAVINDSHTTKTWKALWRHLSVSYQLGFLAPYIYYIK